MPEVSGCETSPTGGAIMRRLSRALAELGLADLFKCEKIVYDYESFILPELSHEAASRIATQLEKLTESIEKKFAQPTLLATTIFESDHQGALQKELTEFHTVPVGYSIALVKVDQ
jgi:hypothetical protein